MPNTLDDLVSEFEGDIKRDTVNKVLEIIESSYQPENNKGFYENKELNKAFNSALDLVSTRIRRDLLKE